MAFMRGDTYVWSDGDRVHLWASDGYDYWDDSIWACAEDDIRRENRAAASGVGLQAETLDELAVMLVARMAENGTFAATVDRALAKWHGDSDCSSLERFAEELKHAMAMVGSPAHTV
jgi:hypothetical protein